MVGSNLKDQQLQQIVDKSQFPTFSLSLEEERATDVRVGMCCSYDGS